MAIPTDYLAKRKKVPEISSARKPTQAAGAQSPDVMKKQSTTLGSQKTQKEQQKRDQERHRLEQIARENIEIQVERENVKNVEFNELFIDNLP